jgi:hypothetical protein
MSKIRHQCEHFIFPEPFPTVLRPNNWNTIQETAPMKALILLLIPLPAVGGYWLMGRIDRFIDRIHRP